MVIDESKYLPNWKEAEVHGQASKVGFYDEQSHNVCHCCQQKVEKREIPLCQNTKSLEFLGFGFPLFYMFIRNCLLLLILLIVSNNLISLYISVQDGTNYCNAHPPMPHVAEAAPHGQVPAPHHFLASRFSHNNEEAGQGGEEEEDPNLYLSRKCESFFIMIARTDKSLKDYEVVLRIGSFIIHVLALLYIKDKIIKTWAYYDEMESDLSDYAVIVKNIPDGTTGVKERLANFITKDIRFFKDDNDKVGSPFEIHEIILIPEAERVHKIHEEEEEALEHYLHAKSIGETHLDHHLEHLEKLHKERHHVVNKCIEQINKDTIPATNAIIVFETEPQKEHFLDNMEKYNEENKLGQHFGNPEEPIIIEEAPEPREIIYENLQYAHGRAKNILLGWGLSLLFLAVITVVFYLLQLVKTNNLVEAIEEEEENPNSSEAKSRHVVATIIAWATLLGIVFFNKFVMGNVLHYFTHLEKHDNKAHEDFSFAFKYALGMFFTTAFMTILVQALKFKNYYKHDFGVIEEETIMFILCAFLVPLIWTIHPLQLCHVHARNKHYGSSDVTQHEANHLMADYHYDMGKRYAELIEMMWFTFLYADLIPIGAFLIFVGFCIYYWVDKYNLLRRSSLEGNISGDLAMKCLFLLDLTLFWRFLGELIFDVQIREGANTLTLIFLGLSILYMLVPWEAFLELVNSENFKLNDKRFTDERHRFDNDNYKLYHPIYKEVLEHVHGKGGQFELDVNEMFLFAKTLPGANPNATSSHVPNNSHSGNNAPVNPLATNVINTILNPGANPGPQSPTSPQGTLRPTGHASYFVPNNASQKPNISFNYK